MTMNPVYYQEHDDDGGWNPVDPSSTGPGRWWSGPATRSTLEEPVLLKSSSTKNDTFYGEKLTSKPLDHDTHQVFNITNGRSSY